MLSVEQMGMELNLRIGGVANDPRLEALAADLDAMLTACEFKVTREPKPSRPTNSGKRTAKGPELGAIGEMVVVLASAPAVVKLAEVLKAWVEESLRRRIEIGFGNARISLPYDRRDFVHLMSLVAVLQPEADRSEHEALAEKIERTLAN